MKNFNINKNSTQSGRSMIEMLGVLAIVGVLSVVGIAGYYKEMTKFKINKSIDEISHIVASTRTLYAQQTSYDGLQTDSAIDIGIIPEHMHKKVSSTWTDANNSFNGRVSIYGYYSASTLGKAFILSYQNLPKEACIALATHDWGSNHSSGLLAISVSDYGGDSTGPYYANVGDYDCDDYNDGYNRVYACPGDANNPTPMNVSTAASVCNNCSENGCSVTWKFN